MGLGPNASHFLIPAQCFAGWGAFHRRLPTGGAAKGIPLNEVTLPALFFTPETVPASVCATDKDVIFPVSIINEYKKNGVANNSTPRDILVSFSMLRKMFNVSV